MASLNLHKIERIGVRASGLVKQLLQEAAASATRTSASFCWMRA
jgi:uncharacterized protein (DUF1778 family)